jgi:hypothetical protein
MLVGGVAGSFGVNTLIRSTRGRQVIGRLPFWGVLLYYLFVAAVVVVGFGWVFRSVLSGAREGGEAAGQLLRSPWLFLAFGVVVGLPFTPLAVTSVWRQARRPAKPRRPATRKERSQYAQDLQRQLVEYGSEAGNFRVELREDEGRILYISGGMARDLAERLVAALRGELSEMGFQRVEGKNGEQNWWVRVEGPGGGRGRGRGRGRKQGKSA